MVDITSISAVVAATGVIVGVVFAILELRNLVKMRQTDLTIRLFSTFGSKEFGEAWENIRRKFKYTDYNEYKKKYGLVAFNQIATYFEEVGFLLGRNLIDASYVYDFFSGDVQLMWETLEPLVQSGRKESNRPQMFRWFEYLYNEMKNREQQLAKIQ